MKFRDYHGVGPVSADERAEYGNDIAGVIVGVQDCEIRGRPDGRTFLVVAIELPPELATTGRDLHMRPQLAEGMVLEAGVRLLVPRSRLTVDMQVQAELHDPSPMTMRPQNAEPIQEAENAPERDVWRTPRPKTL